MINLTITSPITGETLYSYQGISEEEAEFLVAEHNRAYARTRMVDEIENDDSIPDDQKARLYPGQYDLILAERHNLDADPDHGICPDCPCGYDCANCVFMPHDHHGDGTLVETEEEKELREHINANHDRLVADWEEHSLDY